MLLEFSSYAIEAFRLLTSLHPGVAFCIHVDADSLGRLQTHVTWINGPSVVDIFKSLRKCTAPFDQRFQLHRQLTQDCADVVVKECRAAGRNVDISCTNGLCRFTGVDAYAASILSHQKKFCGDGDLVRCTVKLGCFKDEHVSIAIPSRHWEAWTKTLKSTGGKVWSICH